MQKITFEDTQVTKKPYVTINETEYEVQDGTYTGGTDLNATTFNNMQDNIESAIDENANNIGNLTDLNTETKESLVKAINETNTKNCLTIKRTENTLDVTAWQNYDVSFPIISSQKGNKLSVNENGQVVIGTGINYIKVNLNFEFVCSVTTTSYIQFKILKNSEIMAVNRIYNLTANIREFSNITPVLIPVTQGDIIKMRITPAIDGTLTLGGGNFAYMTIETI